MDDYLDDIELVAQEIELDAQDAIAFLFGDTDGA